MLTLEKLPVLAELAPTVVPSIAPPFMSADEVDKELNVAAPELLIVLKAPVCINSFHHLHSFEKLH